ncbi:transposase IS66 family protein [Candidatus Erwinia dacicola]|uniref:Transposase IS66 family protein n=1 Tax=Candidatus Erwinia dacicola TaxID=252393 RepID=A0A328TBW1_9GAMM|nr:transposase IS66 family protein [Candidatus Erwinia dacicola]
MALTILPNLHHVLRLYLDEQLAVRKEQTVPLMQSLYDWIQVQMTVLSRHSDTAKAFAYLLKQWDALNLYSLAVP